MQTFLYSFETNATHFRLKIDITTSIEKVKSTRKCSINRHEWKILLKFRSLCYQEHIPHFLLNFKGNFNKKTVRFYNYWTLFSTPFWKFTIVTFIAKSASIAQWQSTGLVNQGSWVRISLEAFYFFSPQCHSESHFFPNVSNHFKWMNLFRHIPGDL